jgi:hypothetical protein
MKLQITNLPTEHAIKDSVNTGSTVSIYTSIACFAGKIIEFKQSKKGSNIFKLIIRLNRGRCKKYEAEINTKDWTGSIELTPC